MLVIELACGEPADMKIPGATRAASEWVDVLRQAGRKIFPFLLWIDWSEAVNRLMDRCKASPNVLQDVWWYMGSYSFYEHDHSFAKFPTMPEFQEVGVNTTNRTSTDIVDEIMRGCGLILET